jgi:hypothetical protein
MADLARPADAGVAIDLPGQSRIADGGRAQRLGRAEHVDKFLSDDGSLEPVVSTFDGSVIDLERLRGLVGDPDESGSCA